MNEIHCWAPMVQRLEPPKTEMILKTDRFQYSDATKNNARIRGSTQISKHLDASHNRHHTSFLENFDSKEESRGAT